MKKIAIALMLVGGLATAGQADAQWHHGGGGYAGAAVVGGLAGLLVGSAVANSYRAPAVVYQQPVYAQPVYSAPPGYCYDAYGRAYACAPAPAPGYYAPPPPPGW